MKSKCLAALTCLSLAAAVHAQPSATGERIVAERVLRLGGAVILEGQQQPILDLDQLPHADFRIHTLDLVGVSMGGGASATRFCVGRLCRT